MVAEKCNADVGPQSGRRRSDIAPTSARSSELRRRPDVGPMSERRRSDVGAASARRRSDIDPSSPNCSVVARQDSVYISLYGVYTRA